MQNKSYFVSYAIFHTTKGDKAYARYQAEEPGGGKDNENYQLSQIHYKKAKKLLKELEYRFDVSLKHGNLKKLIKKAQENGKKELYEIQKYIKKKLEEKGVL